MNNKFVFPCYRSTPTMLYTSNQRSEKTRSRSSPNIIPPWDMSEYITPTSQFNGYIRVTFYSILSNHTPNSFLTSTLPTHR